MCRAQSEGGRRCPAHSPRRTRTEAERAKRRAADRARYAARKAAAGGTVRSYTRQSLPGVAPAQTVYASAEAEAHARRIAFAKQYLAERAAGRPVPRLDERMRDLVRAVHLGSAQPPESLRIEAGWVASDGTPTADCPPEVRAAVIRLARLGRIRLS